MASSPVKDFFVTFLMPSKCYEQIFVNFHMHVPCIKLVLGKIFGFWILLDTLLAQLPQLLKILWRGSATGLNLTSALLQLYAFSCPVIYAVASNFPLFAWSERLFLLVPTAAIVFLILYYRGDTHTGVLFLLVYSGLMILLGSYATAAVTSVMQATSLAALITSKGLQARTNYHNGQTGQLSTLSVFLTWAGSVAVTLKSLQDKGSSFATVSHLLSACLSCVLLAQIFCYRSSTSPLKRKTSRWWRTVIKEQTGKIFLPFKKMF